MGLVSPERRRNGEIVQDVEQSFVSGEASEIRLPGIEEEDSMVSSPPTHSSPRIAPDSAVPTSRVSRRRSGDTASPKRKRDILDPPEFFDLRPLTGRKSLPASPEYQLPEPSEPEDDYAPNDADFEGPSEPHLTIAEKLHAAQAEAEEAAAAKRDDFASARKEKHRTTKVSVSFGSDGARDEEQDDTVGKIVSPIKKTKIRGRPKRRKSTLSPEELEELMMAADG